MDCHNLSSHFHPFLEQVVHPNTGLDELLSSTLGTVFPAYRFLALLILLTTLRWKDLYKVLLAERLLLTHGALPDEGLSWQSFLYEL